MKHLLPVCLFFLSLVSALNAQNQSDTLFSTISGVVSDKNSEQRLGDVILEILNYSPPKRVMSDENGEFVLPDVVIGRYRVLARSSNYRDAVVSDIVVGGGKDAVIEVTMEQLASALTTASEDSSADNKKNEQRQILLAKSTKDNPNNPLAGICARPFTIEEVTRFAGSRFDPARLVTNYAGACGYDDSRNDIVIRGNSPSYVLWQIEELPVENPNHITSLGTTGGTSPILNVYAMGKADFLTGPLAAQYGNTIGGVFDIKLRNGNPQKWEGMFQIGTQRAELLVEGPLGKKLKGASMLLSLRGSTGAYFMNRLVSGREFADPEHQDVNLKITLGKQKWGALEFFGIGGRSFLKIPYTAPTYYQKLRYDIYEGEEYKHLNIMALGGLKYTFFFSRKTYWRNIVGMAYHLHTARWTLNEEHSSGLPNSLFTTYSIDAARRNYMWHSYVRNTPSKQWTFKTGFIGNLYDVSLYQIFQLEDWIDMKFIRKFGFLQAYSQAQLRPVENLIMDWGVHANYFTFNKKYSVEPRFSIKWEFAPGHTLGAGYGWTHQMQPSQVQFFTPVNGVDSVGNFTYDYSFFDLNFLGSHQVALDYNWNLHTDWRIQLQTYAQFIDNNAVTTDSTVSSPINAGASFYDGFLFYGYSLQSTGKARNIGIELTVEKFFSHGYYGLLSATFYDSRYQASDGYWYNTAFNNRYIVNFLIGKEFVLDKKQRRNTLFLDLKFSTMGGKPYTPIDLEATYQAQMAGDVLEVFDESQNYSKRLKPFYQVDFKFGFRHNGKRGRSTHTFRFDLFNVFDIKNAYAVRYSERYDPLIKPEDIKRGTEEIIYQRGFLPDFTYSVQF